MAEHRSKRRRRPGVIVLVPLALLASSAVVYQASNAAFSAQTTNGSNTWSSGSVTLTDNDSSTALFTVPSAKPGDSGVQCIVVTYNGTLAANVKFYVSAYSSTAQGGGFNGLGQYLNLTVEQGTGGAGTGVGGSCTNFTSTSTLTDPNETLATLSTGGSANDSWANGIAAWNPAGAAESRAYRFTWQMQDTTGTNAQTQTELDKAQGGSASATFAWEARNT